MNSNSRIPNTENKLNGQQLYSPVYYLGFRKFVIILKIVIVSYLQSFNNFKIIIHISSCQNIQTVECLKHLNGI